MTTSAGSGIVRALTAGLTAVGLVVLPACGRGEPPKPDGGVAATTTPTPRTTVPAPPPPPPVGDIPEITALVTESIAAHRLPRAVVQVGHAGRVAFRRAFGERKLAGEPGLNGTPSAAEPMTTDTLFDLASLTKILATTTAVLQLYEQGKVALDDPVAVYLPEFDTGTDPRRARVTLRMVLTHTSGIGGDLSRQGPWGLVAADPADGLRRALTAPLEFDPGTVFHYSDIGFILLGRIVEQLSGQPLDGYVRDHVFGPLGMTDTRYLPAAQACGPHRVVGTAVVVDPGAPTTGDCPDGTWSTDLLARVAPTARDEDTPGINPHIDLPLRGTVHDPTARRMGGVAGSAGVFSTAADIGTYAQALLDRLAGRPSTFPLQQSTLELMTTPQQPGHNPGQVEAANAANRWAIETTPNADYPLLAPHYPAIFGQDLRGLGWDIDTYQSTPRGLVFPVGSVGHTGFAGVSVWIDPGSDSYVVVLGNVIHQRGGPPISRLSGEVATVAARMLHLYGS